LWRDRVLPDRAAFVHSSCNPRLVQASSAAAIATTEVDVAGSEWTFKTARELTKALLAKKVSSVELTQAAIAQIEKHDGKVPGPSTLLGPPTN
jgi:hypothetical protein